MPLAVVVPIGIKRERGLLFLPVRMKPVDPELRVLEAIRDAPAHGRYATRSGQLRR
jgi:hypothetical protein